MDPREAIAHVLRRAAFGPRPGLVDELGPLGPAGVVELLVDGAADAVDSTALLAGSPGRDDDGAAVVSWWLQRLRSPDARLHERMVWYWHGHFTSSVAKVEAEMMWLQHLAVRRHALGNFRDLTRAMVTDAAMLVYLDGDGSSGEMPNENLARELMELFTLGVGSYSEDDVKAGARALSGWWVDWETTEVHFEPHEHYDRPVTFLGRRARWDAEAVVDAVCDHSACPAHVARGLYRHLVGVDPAPDRLDALARGFRDTDLEILPLVAEILRGEDFHAAVRSRPRQPVEWLVAALASLGADDAEIDPYQLETHGQVPFMPPNVAGWPDDERWLAGSQVLTRVNQVLQLGSEELIDADVLPEVDEVLDRCGIYEVSSTTREVLDQAATAQSEYEHRLELLFALALTSPEFALA